MGITLLSPTPGAICFAKNPVLFRLRSLDVSLQTYAARGAVALLQAGSSDKFAAGESMTITYVETDGTTESVVFVASSTYIAPEDGIPDNTFAGSSSQYWEIVKNKVQAHHRIAPFFVITRTGPIGGNSIYITAIDTDPDFTVEVANTAGYTNTNTAAIADTTPDNYAVLMEVFVESTYKAGNYTLAAQLENTPDAEGYLYFDISGILEAECRTGMIEPLVPVWSTADTALADNIRRYYIRFTEKYGAPAVNQEWEYDDVRLVMAGGISQSLFALGDFLGGMDIADALLTWMPDGRKIGLLQPEFLAWYNWDVATHLIKIERQWYDINDNTLSSSTFYFTALEVAAHEVGLLPVNPTLLEVDIETDAYKYRVRVLDADTEAELSQWRTYYIDRDYYESERYVMYLNGFGTPECWRCTGEWGKKLSVQRSVAETPLLPGYNELAVDRFQFARLYDNELTYRTGYITRAEAEVLQEMLIAGEVYDVSSEGYIPLRITANSFAVTDTNQDLHAYQFTAQPRLDMRNFSKKKLSSLLSGAWQEVGGEAWFDAFMVSWDLPE